MYDINKTIHNINGYLFKVIQGQKNKNGVCVIGHVPCEV